MTYFEVYRSDLRDLEVLVDHRLKMWKAIYPEKKDDIDRSESATREWIQDKVGEGSLIPFIARDKNGTVVGSGCILLKEDQPRPFSDKIYNPYLLSVYTEESFRKNGVATEILKEAVEWSKREGYDRMTLHASPNGKHLYESFGFTLSNEMRLWF